MAAMCLAFVTQTAEAQRRGGRGAGWSGGWGGNWGLGGGYYDGRYYDGRYYDGGYSQDYIYPQNTNPNSSYQSFYPRENYGQGIARTRINVRLPNPNAQVLVQDELMPGQGTMRTMNTPPLESGYTYNYQVKARWTENGKSMEQVRTVRFQPGQQVTVDFTAPAPQTPTPRVLPGEGTRIPKGDTDQLPPREP